MSRFLLATCAILMVAGCSAANGDTSADEDTSNTSEALATCGWLAGGECTSLHTLPEEMRNAFGNYRDYFLSVARISVTSHENYGSE